MYKPEEFIRDWLGVPHIYNGRDSQGVDCYGLVWLYYRDVLGITLPDWRCADTSRLWVARFMEERLDESLSELDEPQDHCLMIIRRSKLAHHMGIFYAGGILHCPEKGGVIYQSRFFMELAYQNIVYGVPDGCTTTSV